MVADPPPPGPGAAFDDPIAVDPVVRLAGRDPLRAGERRGGAPVVAVVPDDVALEAEALRRPAVLGLLRRADLLVPASTAAAEALADRVPVAPWDMLVAPAGPDAAAIAAALDRLAGRPRRPRQVALVTPLPPEPTGVADYSARLAAALARRVRVTCVVAGDGHVAPAGCGLVGVAAFEAAAAAGRFDEIVYVLGNQPRHGTQLALLRRWPGAVELHDVRLVGAYAGLYPPGDALADELARLEPGRFPPSMLRESELRMGPSVAAGVWLVREVAERATVTLTHSAHAAALVRAEVDVDAPGVDAPGVDALDVGPLACPPVEAARDAPAPGDEPLVVSVGVVDASKRPDALVRALAALPGAAWLAFVGPVTDDDRRALQRLADAHGVGGRVVLTGRVDDRAYDAWLRRAAVAVQLRAHSNGESSAAVADCLARGVPTVVNALGSAAELPADVAAAVADAGGAVDEAELATTIGALLADVDRRRAFHAAARRYATANGFDAAADRLLAALFGTGRA